MPSNQWGCCNPEEGNNEQFITCKKCNKQYHIACISGDESQFTSDVCAKWNCPDCARNAPKSKKKDSTPVRNVSTNRGSKRQALNSPPVDKEQTDAPDDVDIRVILEGMQKKMDDNFATMRSDMINVLNEKLKPITSELSQINESISFISSQYEDIKRDNEASKLKIAELENENVQLNSTVNELSLRLNHIEQQSRQNNIELQCVPEHKNENLTQIITQLGKSVGCIINSNDIMNCTRTAKVDRSSTRPRSIVVQLASPRFRDQLLSSVISYNKANPKNKLNSTHLGLADGGNPVFISEHLSPMNKALHAAARRTAKEKGYKFVWIRNGKIFMRKSEESDLVRNMDTLKNIP